MSKFLIAISIFLIILSGIFMLRLDIVESIIYIISAVVFLLLGFLVSAMQFNKKIEAIFDKEET